MKNKGKVADTTCSRCGRKIPVEEVTIVRGSTNKSTLYVAKCITCHHTIYGSELEEMIR